MQVRGVGTFNPTTHVVVQCSPLGVHDHVLPRIFSTLLSRGNLLISQLLDRPRVVDVRAVGTGTEDGSDERRAVLVRARQQRSDSLESVLLKASNPGSRR